MEITKLTRKKIKKGSQKYDKEKANKVENKFKLNVDEQQDGLQDLKEYCELDDIDSREKKRLCV